ncbi:MAG: hypothetical protein PUC53_02480 [Bacteroidales bacterium]|nr:hypothetical protein [Bacteroidales bacterium]
MNKIFKYGLILLGASLLAACQAEILSPDQSKLPVASELKADIQVDQSTNVVTFSILDQGVVPVWIFGDEKIDGKVSKKYAYVQNGVQLRIRDAGEHTVELRAYNANGLSQGSQKVTFTLENTYRDPFDPTPYMKAMANEWVWDKMNNGHFGCGETADNPTGWWSCGANGKDGVGLYDDVMTFTTDGKFTFNPGEGGTVYANKDVSVLGGSIHDEDYEIPIEEFTCDYTIENNWNDAGIEEIYLVLPEGKNLSYVPNNDAVGDNARYLFVNTKPADIKKNLKLVNYSATANGGGSIAWLYSFVPNSSGPSVEEFLAGTSGKSWVMDSQTKGHLACGPSFDDPAGWWAAGPDEKAGFGMYDNVLTFYPDGKYVFDSGADGMIYANKDVTLVPGGPQGEDYMAEWPKQESTYVFDGETITLPEGVVIGYVPNDGSYTNPVFHVKSITETTLVLVSVGDGISWQYIFKVKESNYDIDGEGNLWRSASINPEYWYSPADWSGNIAPQAELTENNGFTAVIPEGVGGNEWQAQNKLISDIVIEAGQSYDFCCTIEADADMTVTVKLAAYPGDDKTENELYYNNNVTLGEYTANTLKLEKLVVNAPTGTNLILIFDFGRSPVGSTVNVSDICFQKSN